MSPLHDASRAGDTKLVRQLLNNEVVGTAEEIVGALVARVLARVVRGVEERPVDVNEKDEDGYTALMLASQLGHTEVVKLLLDKGALFDAVDARGSSSSRLASSSSRLESSSSTALMLASMYGRTKVVELLLDQGALPHQKDENGRTALMLASLMGRKEVVQLLLNMMLKRLLEKGASLDEKDEDGDSLLMKASKEGHTELVQLLLDKGALVAVDARGDAVLLLVLAGIDEDHLGRMAAAQTHGHLLQPSDERGVPGSEVLATVEATATAVLNLVRLAGSAAARARKLRSSDPRSADDHQVLFTRLQLAAAACVQRDETGKARAEKARTDQWTSRAHEDTVQDLLRSVNGRKALEHAVEIGAKELLAQPVVQGYIKATWRGVSVGRLVDGLVPASFLLRAWVLFFFVLLLNLLFLLPLVVLMPALELWLAKQLEYSCRHVFYLLHLPIVKFGLECAADLALALALTLIPAADLATTPIAPLLLIWVGSGLLWESRQVMASSSDAKSRLARVYDRLTAYWRDNINRVDATALIFSLAALVAFVSTDDSEDPTATSLRAVAVFLLWLRVIRVLLISPQFGPFVLMFFRMLFGDVLKFLVLLLFLLVAFAASWTVLLEPQSSIAVCADNLGGVDFHTTLLRIFEGALTGNDFFECARDSTNSPVAAWVISAVYVTLTAVLLLNMLIAMCAAATQSTQSAIS